MAIQQFLILFPLIAAVILLTVRSERVRGPIVTVTAAAIAVASVALAANHLMGSTRYFAFESELVSYAALGIDVLIGIYILIVGVRQNQYLASVLAFVQTAVVLWYELGRAHSIEVANSLYVDTFSVIMALIIGVIGSGICVYAIGYMRDFAEQHADVPDRRPMFFAVMFAFLSAMFGVVFSNNLAWLFTAWEVTTLCSFLLIGYARTPEATKNAFLQITMNLVGGLAFAVAIAWIGTQLGTLELDQFIKSGMGGAAVAVPVFLLALAGFTKAAQMPFHTWLLGAMVAPTPTSALLHSSTMVKAGVFLLIKLAPLFGLTGPGVTVMLVGGVTFMLCSMMAISQTNAKRVLAYSTIANLGLITACAGVGTGAAIWAAIFLVIFHAAAKSLLFLCVGTAEHHIGSRDIEDMDGLFARMPRLARFMALGIVGMFIAPFGMLISKGAALGAFLDSHNVVLIVTLLFGSAATFFFWAKWLGKITAIAGNSTDDEYTVHPHEWAAIRLMALLTGAAALAFPLISRYVVLPYVQELDSRVTLSITSGDLLIMAVMTALVVAVLVLTTRKSRIGERNLPVYMAGVGTPDGTAAYSDSLGNITVATQRNWYMQSYFGEEKLSRVGTFVSAGVLVCGITVAMITGSVM